MDISRLVRDQVVLDRSRSLRETARSTGIPARTCVARPASTRVLDRDGRPDGVTVLAEQGDGYVLVQVEGVFDIAARSDLIDVLSAAVDGGEHTVIVDLSAVTLLAASGIGCLQTAADLLAPRGRCLLLVCPPGSPAGRILRLLHLHRAWPVHQDRTAAVAAVESRR